MNIIGLKKIWFSISAILIIPGTIALIIWGLNFGIDFKGGTLLELKFTNPNVNTENLKSTISNLELKDLIIQPTQDQEFLIKTDTISSKQHEAILKILGEKIGETQELRYETIGPLVGKDLTNKAIIAVIIASFAIILYIAWAFRGVPKPASSWRFGVCAILALIHDILFVVGAFAILGHYFEFEVDALFITALLTVMGFSVHDTIVVFDRIRENLRSKPGENFEMIVNNSVVQTMTRSLNTSLTVILTLLSLLLLGGQTTKTFVLALLLGIVTGTYSSIFNASPLLVVWQNLIQNSKIKSQKII